MPFHIETLRNQIEQRLRRKARSDALELCDKYKSCRSGKTKAQCLHELMGVLDASVDAVERKSMMESCGVRCLGSSVVEKAKRLAAKATDRDDLIAKLNNEGIGGGMLSRNGSIIHARYSRCYCGAVSKAAEAFSETYCWCSCGWLKGLFEAVLERPVEVRLESSIIQGDEECRFEISARE